MGSPLFMRDVSLTLKLVGGAGSRVEYNCDAHLAEIVPTAGDEVTYVTLCEDGTHSQIGATTYALHVVAAQDWSAEGLARFLWENDGAEAEFQYQAHGSEIVPPTADQPGMAGTCRLVAGAYGGEAEAYAELDVTMPCTTKPTLAIAAFPTAATEPEADTEAA